jgi:GTP diphosphokinase / guanosine-3',5'-bis(diphosphate) 3'-diphosphatase
VELGAQLLNSALEEFQLSVDKIQEAVMNQALLEFHCKDKDDLLAQIGLGERLAPLVARRLLPSGHDESGKITPLTVAGTEGLLVTYARCCRPIPDDPIIAFLSAGRGIVIHRETCGNVEDYHKHPEKWQPVAWQQDLTRYFSAEVRIEAENKIGMLASVSAAIAGTGTNIGHANVEQRDGDVSLIKLEVEVKDRKHLARVVRTIRSMPEVLRVSRYQASRRSQHEE